MRFFSNHAWTDWQKMLESMRAENEALKKENRELRTQLVALVDSRALAIAEGFVSDVKASEYIGTGHDERLEYDENGMPLWVRVEQ